jgi:lipopolysaccharide/colanic/teichoic acid biosynthesis glycosyltransferase
MLKRAFDVVASSLALILLSPLFLVIGAAVKLESAGPALFKQTRIGKNGQPFTMYKFRKFPTAYDGVGPGLTAIDDPRLSRIGRALERLKLDELPQFLNVLKGDMSLVGPRPETPKFVEFYSESARRVFDVKPGIFSINYLVFKREAEMFPAGVNPEEFYVREIMPRKLENDIEYLQRATFTTDLVLLLRCGWTLVSEPLYKKFTRN